MFDLGLAIALLSLVIAVSGAFLSWHALKRSTYRTATDLVLEIDHLFVEKPDLRPFFYSNESLPQDETARGRVEAAAELYLDILEAIWDHRDEFTRADRKSWKEWIHELFETSPVLRDTYVGMEPWYPTLKLLLERERCTMDHRWAASKQGPDANRAVLGLRRFLARRPRSG